MQETSNNRCVLAGRTQTYTFYSTFCEPSGDLFGQPTAASLLATVKQLPPEAQTELLEGIRALVDAHS